jgi:hypothetical protein
MPGVTSMPLLLVKSVDIDEAGRRIRARYGVA